MKFIIICLLFSANAFASDYITMHFWDETTLLQTTKTRKIFEGDSNIKLAVRYLDRHKVNYALDEYGFIYIGDKLRFNDLDNIYVWCLTVNGKDTGAYEIAEEDSEISWHYISITKFVPLDRTALCVSSKPN